MNDMKHMAAHLSHWGDNVSIARVKQSDKGTQWHEAEINNHLSESAQMFQYSPTAFILQKWSRALANAGYKEDQIKDVCLSLPYKFEKFPTFASITLLLRPYLDKEAVLVDELDDLTKRCIPHIKAKFVNMLGQDKLDEMVSYYQKHAYPEMKMFEQRHKEMCILGDWMRSYFKGAEEIIKQGNLPKDRDLYLKHYKMYAKENKL
jgi:hypothetical protein